MKRLFCGWAILQALVVGLGRAFHTQKRDSEKRLKKYGHVFFFIQTELNQWQYALWGFSGFVQYWSLLHLVCTVLGKMQN